VRLLNLPAIMDVVFQIFGSVIAKTIVVMDRMKEISVLKKLVLIISLLVQELVTVSLNRGFAMVMMIASINKYEFSIKSNNVSMYP
jgi:hypothetical protein